MNRRYNAEQIMDLVEYINSKFDNAFIGSDIIVGFPDETEEDFKTTAENLSNTNQSRIHVVHYSRRKGTIADAMANQIENTEKKRRAGIIQKISDDTLHKFFERNLNTENEVIIEKKRDSKTNLLKGVTKNYINVLINADDSYKDTIQKVILKDFSTEKEKMKADML